MSTLEQIQRRHKKSLLNKREAAQELGISQSSLDRLRKSGEIKSKQVGGLIFFSISEIASFIEA
jgi:predicted DNA-binding transcriptional regulator AlpA